MSPRIAHQRNWDLRAAGNFIGGGAGTGLIVTSALAAAVGAPFRVALAAGLVLVLTGLSLVWLEIGKPWRALNVLFHPGTSWMTREALVAGVMVPAGMLGVVTGDVAITATAAALACGFLWCQARMLRAARGVPAWRQAEIVPFILATGLAEGSALYLLAGARTMPWLMLALLAGLVREAAWLVYRAGLARTPAAAPGIATFKTPLAGLTRELGLVGLALIALALASTVIPAGVTQGVTQVLACAGGLLIALAGGGLKALLITRAGFIRTVAIPAIPTRGSRGSHARQTP